MRTDNIILIGFMGTGKTTVGRLLTEKLGWTFVDTDQLIIEKTGMEIAHIFAEKGERWFRDQETEVVKQVLEGSKQVVSTGGGSVLRKQNRETMINNGMVVALKADAQTIIARVSMNDERPLLQGDHKQKVLELLEQRKAAYDFAHYQLDTAALGPHKLCEEIVRLWKTFRSS